MADEQDRTAEPKWEVAEGVEPQDPSFTAYAANLAEERRTQISEKDIARDSVEDYSTDLVKLWVTGFPVEVNADERLEIILKVLNGVTRRKLWLIIERSRLDYALVRADPEHHENTERTLAIIRAILNEISATRTSESRLYARWTHISVSEEDNFDDHLRQVTSHFASREYFDAVCNALDKDYGIVRGAEFLVPDKHSYDDLWKHYSC